MTPTSTEVPARCQVFIRGDHIDLDGTPTDLPAVIARCRAAGHADVKATGDAVVRAIADVVRALQSAGVLLSLSPAVSRAAEIASKRTP